MIRASLKQLSHIAVRSPTAMATRVSLPTVRRCFSTTSKFLSSLNSELQHEKTNYQQHETIAPFLERSGWTFTEVEGDVNMVMKKTVNDIAMTIEFQLVQPNYAADEGEGNESQNVESQDSTDFSVTCEKSDGQGVVFYCSTVTHDEKFRFIVGNIRYFANNVEKTRVSAYTGPDYEDLEDNMQAGIDEWLSSLGINEELCDFVDSVAVDKEHREYMRWLECLAKIVQ